MVEDYPQERKPSSPEDEIRELERRLEEKKREAAEKGGVELPPEKEVFREVLKEHIQALKQPPVSPQPITPPLPSPPPASGIKEHAREEEVRALIEVALTKSILEAVKIAERDSPYMLDELHDHLADDFYEKLVALRRIKQF